MNIFNCGGKLLVCKHLAPGIKKMFFFEGLCIPQLADFFRAFVLVILVPAFPTCLHVVPLEVFVNGIVLYPRVGFNPFCEFFACFAGLSFRGGIVKHFEQADFCVQNCIVIIAQGVGLAGDKTIIG